MSSEDKLEKQIITGFIVSEQFRNKVYPFIIPDLFQNKVCSFLFKILKESFDNYAKILSKTALEVEIEKYSTSDELTDSSFKLLENALKVEKIEEEWLLDEAEKWVRNRKIHKALVDSIEAYDTKKGMGSVPDRLQQAISSSFNSSIGHDYLTDYDIRYQQYTQKEEKVPFYLKMFDEITSGGLSKKTLSVVMALTGVGKTICLCDLAAKQLSKGHKVLYITLEMSEVNIAKRMDANLLNIDINRISDLSRIEFQSKILKLYNTIPLAKLVIQEYPAASVSVSHFKRLLSDLKIKKNFVPDIIYVDYINLMLSTRSTRGDNSYTTIKMIAEELRGLATEFNVPLFTATQVNRQGASAKEIELTDTSDSFGLPYTADLFFTLTTSDELSASNQIQVRQLKNRYNDLNRYKTFRVGIEKPKMRLYDLSNYALEDERPTPHILKEDEFVTDEDIKKYHDDDPFF
jgi:replicative DNA helicase